MPISTGTRLGSYELGVQIGAGGMGEVYQAHDTKLGRDVAIKVLPEAFEHDPERLSRFQREAKMLASLNHPNIATIYGLEQTIGTSYLVMELVAGETLADRIKRDGAVPIEEALGICKQIAEALEAAHEKGIIHRDLKPANVKVTPEGKVKVLDFGLAKAFAGDVADSNPSQSPTLSAVATMQGVFLGTAAYMSPEQARGKAVDKRADIWAFGCVLYELVVGKRVFDGESLTDALAAVVRAEPNWSALPKSTPASIRRLLKRCLEKDRKRRLPDIGVAGLEIDDALAVPEEPSEKLPTPKRRTIWWLVATVVLAAGGVGTLWQARRTPTQELWSGVMLGGPAGAFSPRLSPDGQLLTFLAFIDELPQVGVMKPDGGSWTMLTRDRDSGYVATVAWAPDGSKIYFDRYWGQPRGVYTVPPLGGEPRLLFDDAFGPEPLPEGSLIVAKLTGKADDQLIHYWPDSGRMEPLPAFLEPRDVAPLLRAFPDGKEIVYFGTNEKTGRTQSPRMYVMDLASQRARELAPGFNLDTSRFSPLAIAPDGESVLVLGIQEDTRLLM